MKANKMARKMVVARKMTLKRAARRDDCIAIATGSHTCEVIAGDDFARSVTLRGIASMRRWNRYTALRDRLRSMGTDKPEYYTLSAELHGLKKELQG